MSAVRSIAFLAILLISSTPIFAEPAGTVVPADLNIRDLSTAENAHYGRELYLTGKFPEAVKVFESILRQDCNNTYAQFHLQKIAQKSAEFNYLNGFLRALPCSIKDFSKEDILPASLFYEKDPAILLEQLSIYNRRYVTLRNNVTAKIDSYARATAELETQVDELSQTLVSHAAKSSVTTADLKKRLDLARDSAKRMDDEVVSLKGQLARATIEKNRNILYPDKTPPAAGTAEVKPTAQEIDTRRDEVSRQDLQLTGLRAKFTAIQERLNAIEQTLTDKNTRMETIRRDINTTRK